MDEKTRRRIQLDCLYGMFRDRIEENVIYLVYNENDGKIHATIDQLMSIAACSFVGHSFEQKANSQEGQRISHTSLKDTTGINGKLCKSPVEEGTKENDETEVDIEEEIKELQLSIDKLLLEKNASHDKASKYLSKKMYPVTSYYSEWASQLRRMIDLKTNKLVNLILRKSENSNQIDLHGLNPIQARLVVSELLQTRQHKLMIDKQGEASIDIITGWGKHSVSHGHKIRPTIVSLLREKSVEFHHLNRGALRVTIRR